MIRALINRDQAPHRALALWEQYRSIPIERNTAVKDSPGARRCSAEYGPRQFAPAIWYTVKLDQSSDAPHELQERLRRTIEQANELIDTSDPREDAEQIEAWVQRTVAHDVVAAFEFLDQRTREKTQHGPGNRAHRDHAF